MLYPCRSPAGPMQASMPSLIPPILTSNAKTISHRLLKTFLSRPSISTSEQSKSGESGLKFHCRSVYYRSKCNMVIFVLLHQHRLTQRVYSCTLSQPHSPQNHWRGCGFNWWHWSQNYFPLQDSDTFMKLWQSFEPFRICVSQLNHS